MGLKVGFAENINRFIPGTMDHQEHQIEKVFLEVTMQE